MYLDRRQQFAVTLAVLPVAVIWLVNGLYMTTLARISVSLFWFVDFIQWIVLPTTLLVFLAKSASVLPKHYGFDASTLRWLPSIMGALAVFVTTGLVFFLAIRLWWLLFDRPTGFFAFPEVFPGGLARQIIWFYSSVTAGIIESIFFIGLPWLLYRNIKNEPSCVAFTFISSVIYATAHWEQGPDTVVAVFCFQLVACVWFFKLRTLWPIAAGHTLVDMVAFS